MKIQYLGTAAAEGWPGLFCRCEVCRRAREAGGKNIRTRSQALIDDAILMDFPPDTYLHMLRDDLPLPEIRTLLLTHSHQDHWYPEDLAFRGEGFSHDIDGILEIYGNEACAKRLEAILPIVGQGMMDAMRAHYNEVTAFSPFETQGYRVTPLKALHNRAENCLIYLIEKDGKSLLYANDTGLFPQETWEYLRGRKLDLVSMDCTMQQIPEGTNHMGLADNAELCRRLGEAGCTHEGTKYVITHFSHNGGLLHEELEERARPLGFLTAYDGMTLSF